MSSISSNDIVGSWTGRVNSSSVRPSNNSLPMNSTNIDSILAQHSNNAAAVRVIVPSQLPSISSSDRQFLQTHTVDNISPPQPEAPSLLKEIAISAATAVANNVVTNAINSAHKDSERKAMEDKAKGDAINKASSMAKEAIPEMIKENAAETKKEVAKAAVEELKKEGLSGERQVRAARREINAQHKQAAEKSAATARQTITVSTTILEFAVGVASDPTPDGAVNTLTDMARDRAVSVVADVAAKELGGILSSAGAEAAGIFVARAAGGVIAGVFVPTALDTDPVEQRMEQELQSRVSRQNQQDAQAMERSFRDNISSQTEDENFIDMILRQKQNKSHSK